MLFGADVLTTAQMRAIESAAMAEGKVTGLDLMERAGRAVAGQIRLGWPKAGRATLLCGPGNNGGDGYVVARHLHAAGWQVRVLGTDDVPGADAAQMRHCWQTLGPILPLTVQVLGTDPGDLIIDAMFGIGLTRPLTGSLRDIGQWLSCSTLSPARPMPPIVAIDGPSGLCLDSGVILGQTRQSRGAILPRVTLTVTFHTLKPGHLLEDGPTACGRIVVADIGLARVAHESAMRIMAKAGQTGRPIRTHGLDKAPSAHKFDHGSAVVIAGGIGAGGAARLAAHAALRVGAGLVTLAPTASALAEHAGPPDAFMRHGVDDAVTLAMLLKDSRRNAICIGPGCGVDRADALLDTALRSGRAVVIDADALTALSRRQDPMGGLHDRCILTPHGGEFGRLFPEIAERLSLPDLKERNPADAVIPMRGPLYSRLDAVRDAAARCGAIVLLKGPDTVIAAPDGRARIHSSFDVPWLATAGSGDVLAGLITGLMARGQSPLDAASIGVLIHAQAARDLGPGLIADDLPQAVPQVLRGMV